MTTEQIWSNEDRAAVLGIDVPAWVDAEISPATIISIYSGGCASGAYMPACEYVTAVATMGEHGDAVLGYIDDAVGELPPNQPGDSWGGMAVRLLSTAVDLWAGAALTELEDLD